MNKLFLKIILSLFICFLSSTSSANDNKIIFKISDKSFTTFDYEKRKEYVLFVGDNENLTKEEILNDFISAIIFHEFYLYSKNKLDLDEKVKDVFDDILKKKNIDLNQNILDKENIFLNLKYDLIRKFILEDFLNSNKNEILNSDEDIDLIYNFKLKYINVYLDELSKYENELQLTNFSNIEEIESFLKNKKIKFFLNENEINNVNKINKTLIKNINNNNNLFIKRNENMVSFISLKKNFETYDGLIANIFTVKSKNKLISKDLECQDLNDNSSKLNVNKKEYEFAKLNKELKNNLININDFIEYKNSDFFNYVILCGMKFNMEVLKDLNLNKKISLKVDEIEKNFIKNYSKKFNLIILNE